MLTYADVCPTSFSCLDFEAQKTNPRELLRDVEQKFEKKDKNEKKEARKRNPHFVCDVEQEEGVYIAHPSTQKFVKNEKKEEEEEEESFEHQLMQKFDCAHTKMAYLYQQVSY